MAQKYITLSEEALAKMCGLIRDSHSIAEAIDDENIANNSTYSSLKIQELLGEAGVTAIELTKAEYDALSDEEKNSDEVVYFVPNTEALPEEVEVVTELNDTVTDKQVPSAKTMYNTISNCQKTYDISSDGIITTLDSTSTYPYVCTEDCLMNVARLACVEGSSGTILRVNGIAIATGSSSTIYSNLVCPLCKGDSVYFDDIATLHTQTRIRIIKQKNT
jgi:hypothetical protein